MKQRAAPERRGHSRARRLNQAGAGTALVAAAALGYGWARSRSRPSPIPRDTRLDSSLALLSEGYTFISNPCRRHQTDLFETRLMFNRAICMLGEEAAREFYVPDRFTRQRAVPATALLLLQDSGSVQLLDGDAHRHRKQMFMSLMQPARVQQLVDRAAAEWPARIGCWKGRAVVLHDEVRKILCRAVCDWAGVPLPRRDVARRARAFGAMIDGSGRIGPQNWTAMIRRSGTERWIQSVIEEIRSGRLDVPAGTAAHTIAWHRDADGRLLDTGTAAVELINVLRPVVAVARFVTFAALALHRHPDSARRIAGGDAEYLDWFVQEVRRYYPFFPAIGGRVLTEFTWRGVQFAPGTWVLLDLYGTNHDPRIWGDPASFRPERFRDWNGSAYNFIPQGGGEHGNSHRCPGEGITTALMKSAIRQLVMLRYDVLPQDLRIRLSRMPALPESGFVIANVRLPA